MAHIDSRLSLDISDFNKSLNQASDKINKFAKGGPSSFGGMIGSVSKLAASMGAIGAGAAAAMESFKRLTNATESMSDSVGRSMRALSSGVDSFFFKLASGSFDGFIGGLKDVVTAARDAYDAIDDLQTLSKFQDADIQKVQTKRLETQLKIRKARKSGASDKEMAPLYAELVGYDDQIEKMAKEKAAYAVNAYNKAMKEAVAGTTITRHGWTTSIGESYLEEMVHKWADSWDNGDGTGFKFINDKIEEKTKELADLDKKASEAYAKIPHEQFNWNINSGHYGELLFSTDQSREWSTTLQRADNLAVELQTLKVIADQEGKITEAKEYQKIAEQAMQSSLQKQIQSLELLKEKTKDVSEATFERIEMSYKAEDYTKTFMGNSQMIGNRLSAKVKRGSATTVNEAVLANAGFGKDYGMDRGYSFSHISKSDFEGLSASSDNATSSVYGTMGAVESLGSTINGLTDSFDDCSSAWDYFSKALQTSMGIIQSVTSLGSLFNTTKQEEIALNEESATSAVADATAQATDAAAKSVNATASGLSASSATEDAIAKTSEAASAATDATMQTADAGSKMMNAHSYIPFVGVALGAAAIATMIAVLTNLPKFATGGIVGGNSKDGDKILARLNSGELVLNKNQQRSLVNQLGNSAGGGQVEFRIKDRELVGILGNYYNRQSNKL